MKETLKKATLERLQKSCPKDTSVDDFVNTMLDTEDWIARQH